MLSLLYFLGIGGMISSVVYWIYDFVYDFVHKKIFTTVTVYNVDPVYLWLLKYLTEKGYLTPSSMGQSVVKTIVKKQKWWEPTSAKEKHTVEYIPAPGTHFFSYKGKKFWAVQHKGEPQCIGFDNRPHTEESIYIMCQGGGMNLIIDLIDCAVEYSMDQEKGLLGIYQVTGWLSTWCKVMTKKARPLGSVVLDADHCEQLVKDISQF